MKILVATLLTLMAFQVQASSFQHNRLCQDKFAKQFPWILLMSVENAQVTRVLFAEKDAIGKPVFKDIKSLIPAATNQTSTNGTKYQIAIETIQGTVAGKMDVSVNGVVNISMGEEQYLLFCEVAR